MAIVWGSYSSDGRFQAGIELTASPSTVGASTTSQVITIRSYLRPRSSLSETNFGNNWYITVSATASGQTDYNLSGGEIKLMGTTTRTVSTSYTLTTTTQYTNRIHRNASPGAGYDASVSASYTTQRRPYTAPAPVTGTSAVRNSDSQATITWTRNATTGAPYTSQTVRMRTYSGTSWGSYVDVATVSGTAASYVKTGLSSNRIYQFAVRANNTVGSSVFDYSGYVWTTPGPPANVDSSVSSSGLQITTTWDETSYYSTPRTLYYIERSVNGAAWASVATSISTGTFGSGSWTDSSPGGGNNQYRVRAGNSGLYSGYANGDVVTTVVPPLAPTILVPNGVSVDLNLPLTLTWKHNPGTDKAKQSRFNLQYSATGGTSWFSLPGGSGINSTTSSFVLPGGSLSNGATYLWRVQTQGVESAGYGPYSAAATFTGSTTPVVTIDGAHPADPTTQLPLDTWWVYQQDGGSPQTQWQAELRISDGLQVLEGLTGTTGSTLTWSYPVQDGVRYLVRVRALSGAGIWSNWAEATTTVDLPSPAPALVTATYDECAGVMNLHVESADPSPDELPASWVTVERRVPGGDWVVIATMLEIPNDLIDPLPSTTGVNEYRITSISSAPSYLVNPIVEALGTDGRVGAPFWVFLTWGAGFSQRLRFRGNPTTGATTGRVRAAQAFLGRKLPVLLLGDATSRVVSASGSLYFDKDCRPNIDGSDPLPVTLPFSVGGFVGGVDPCEFDSSVREWETAGNEAGMVAYRDHTGRRLFGMISDITVEDAEPGFGALNFTVTQTGFIEGYEGTGGG